MLLWIGEGIEIVPVGSVEAGKVFFDDHGQPGSSNTDVAIDSHLIPIGPIAGFTGRNQHSDSLWLVADKNGAKSVRFFQTKGELCGCVCSEADCLFDSARLHESGQVGFGDAETQ